MQPIHLWKLFRNTITGQTSKRIYDVAITDPLTLNKNWVAKEGGNRETLFKEVAVVPYEKVLPADYLEDLSKLIPQTKAMSQDKFIELFIDTLTDYIEDVWDPTKFHLVPHSGGWDSRILGSILHKIYEKRGGDFLFVCHSPECGFCSECVDLKTILQMEGWTSPEQRTWLPYDYTYFSYHLNFEKAWQYLNGPCSYPVNNLSWMVDILRFLKRIPSDISKIQFWSSAFFNEIFQYLHGTKLNPVKPFLDKFYYWFSTNIISNLECSFIEPVLNYQTLRHIITSKVDLNPWFIRLHIINALNPALSRVPRRANPKGFYIPDKYGPKILNEYATSWYGKNIRPNIIPDLRFVHSPWWSAWSSASFIHHLLKEGIGVRLVEP